MSAGVLITVLPPALPIPDLLRAAIDAERVGAARLHLAAGQPDTATAVRALRAQTTLVITGDTPGADLVTSGFRDADPPAGADGPAALVIALAELVRATDGLVGLRVAGRDAGTVVLATLAAGGHLTVAVPDADTVPPARDQTALVARIGGLARLAGRLPMDPAAARRLLGIG